MKRKISEKQKLYLKCVKLAKDIAKTRDKYTCQHCWRKTNIHWSHIINEAKSHRLAINPYNIKALCYNCHLNWRHKNPLEASEWFENKRPWRKEELQKLYIEYQKLWSISMIRLEEQYEILKSMKKEQNRITQVKN